MKNSILFLLPVFLLLPFRVEAENYYVHLNSGNDAWSGTTPATPFRSISQLSEVDLQPGDSVLFASGTTHSGEFVFGASGTKEKPVVLSRYGSGERPVFTNPGGWFAIKLEGNYQVVDDLYITDTHFSGILLEGTHAVIKNCEIDHVGIGVEVKNVFSEIHGNYIHDLHMVKNTEGGDDDFGAIGVSIGSDSVYIFKNRIEDCIAPSYDYKVDGGVLEFYGSIRHVRVFENVGKNCDGFFEVGGGDTISDVLIYDNLMLDNGEIGGFHFQAKFGTVVQDFRIERNTIVDQVADQWQVLWFNGDKYASEVSLMNNIIYYSGFQSFTGSNKFIHENNIYFTPDNTPNGALVLNDSEIKADPMFVDLEAGDFRIDVNSPARDMGLDSAINTELD